MKDDSLTPATETRCETTRWTCEKCGASNFVMYPHGASVYDVVHLIEASHESDNRSCETDLARIHVAPEGAA